MEQEFFSEKKILITGGTGTIGSFLFKKLIKTNCKKVIVFSRDESKQYSLMEQYKEYRSKFDFIIGDIRKYQSILMATRDVDYVIHSAAMKQVPIAEDNPLEAALTNIYGTSNVITASIQNNVKKVICLSTDKAVYPANCMGMTKGISERIVKNNRNNSNTEIIAIRLGNVLGSQGSVIPLWKKQLCYDKKISLTSEKMTRFIMTLDDVHELIIYSLINGKNGEIIIPKMVVCRISDLAKCFCSKNGLDYNETVCISGIRKGEKEYEEIISTEEAEYLYQRGDYYHIAPQKQREYIMVKRLSSEYEIIRIDELEHILSSNRIL